MLFGLGMFVFDLTSALPDELARDRDWRNVRTDRFGAFPASQFVGPGNDAITLTGTLIPELAGSYSAITTLAAMADVGEAYPLANGAGTVFGFFTIDKLTEKQSNFIDAGLPRAIGFTIELSRVS